MKAARPQPPAAAAIAAAQPVLRFLPATSAPDPMVSRIIVRSIYSRGHSNVWGRQSEKMHTWGRPPEKVQAPVGGLTTLHMVAGYVRHGAVKMLLEARANPEVEDNRGRSPLDLAKEIRRATPKGNPASFARRIAIEAVAGSLSSMNTPGDMDQAQAHQQPRQEI